MTRSRGIHARFDDPRTPQGFQTRDLKRYGDVAMSIQASEYHNCSPKSSGLPLTKYTHLEVMLYQGITPVMPSDIGIHGFDLMFDRRLNCRADFMARREVTLLQRELFARKIRLARLAEAQAQSRPAPQM